ncbi:MAG: SMI1/KNR4 family protein [Anaerolineae bacterium]|jgi:hypothetical protein
MAELDWQPFLDEWSRAILESPEREYFGLPRETIRSGWLGFRGATETQIAAAEARMGVRLPPSYRTFLQVTNGWQHTGLGIERILPAESIDWFRVLHPEWIAAWMGGFTAFGIQEYEYDPEHDPVDYRHLPKTLAISEAGDVEILLLNPEVAAQDGEWEAWLFVEDGAARYSSFWDLLHAEYKILQQTNQSLAKNRARQCQPSDPPESVVIKLPGLIAELEEKLALVHSMSDTDGIGYQQGVGEGLEIALGRVRDGTQGIADHELLRTRLRSLAAELVAEASRLEAPLQKLTNASLATLLNPTPSLADMLSQMGPMLEGVRAGAKAQGLRQAAMVIRWYLNELQGPL